MKFLRQLLLCALLGSAGFLSTAAFAEDGKDLILNGDAVCTACHEADGFPQVMPIAKTKHGTRADSRTPSCISCHGESKQHQDGNGKPDVEYEKHAITTPQMQSQMCMNCHKRDANRSHWEGSTHQSRDVACHSCHTIHSGTDKVRDKKTQADVCFTCHKEQRAQINRPSHHPIPEGKMTCSDCHNPHGSVGPKMVKRDSVNDTCYTCHMEKRGPFVHNHQPVTEDCAICHNPHGTTSDSMLKVRVPFLCQQCHTPHGAAVPQILGRQSFPNTASTSGKTANAITQGRGCLNCHTQVHGSNNPSATNPPAQFMLR